MIKKKQVDKPNANQNKTNEGILRFQNDIKKFQERTQLNKELSNV